jgi:acyl carrier protein
MKNQLNDMLTEVIKSQDPYLEHPVDLSQGRDAKLYSEAGQLDSLSLVTIIADLEQKIFTALGVRLQIANERDLSIENSPFNTFGRMVDYVEERVLEAMHKKTAIA